MWMDDNWSSGLHSLILLQAAPPAAAAALHNKNWVVSINLCLKYHHHPSLTIFMKLGSFNRAVDLNFCRLFY